MSIRFQHSCFVHIPRTGGTWLQHAALRADVKCWVLKGDVDSHFTYWQLPPIWHQLPAFSFVREPMSWIRSRWTHVMEHQLLDDYRHYGVHRLFDELAKDTLEDTVKTILRRRPGLVSRTYAEMTEGVGSLYRMEALIPHFVPEFQRWEGLTTAQQQIMEQEPPCNGTSALETWQGQLKLPASLVNEFLLSEQEATELWLSAKG